MRGRKNRHMEGAVLKKEKNLRGKKGASVLQEDLLWSKSGHRDPAKRDVGIKKKGVTGNERAQEGKKNVLKATFIRKKSFE